MTRHLFATLGLAVVLCAAVAAQERPVDEEPASTAVEPVAPPSLDTVRSQVVAWVASKNPPSNVVEEIGRLWVFEQTPEPEALFETAIVTFSLVDAESRQFIESCKLIDAPLLPPEASLLQNSTEPIHANNLRLFYGRYLLQRKMYDESLEALYSLKASEVIDPAALLFARAVSQHQLQQKQEGLATLKQLLTATEGVPVRYTTVATLMQYDLQSLDDKTLDGISRKMTDVGRRLTLGRTGPKVQKKEAEIIAGLDEIIKKIEEQQGGGGGQGSDGQNNSNRSSNPANDSRVKGSTAPGTVDPKKLDKEAGWGMLPDKDRAKARDLIGRDFPAHYRQAIEEFNRKQAAREAKPGK